MIILAKHPSYMKFSSLWEKMRDCFDGADHIKDLGQKYLPANPSMAIDGMQDGQPGLVRYLAYKTRAKFPEYVYDSVINHTGILHRKEAVFTLPEQLKYMLTKASSQGEGLAALLRRINQLQLRDGRLGLMLELPEGSTSGTVPYIAVYEAPAVCNWDTGEDQLGYESLNMVVLDESRYVLQHESYEWTWEVRERVLKLGTDATDEAEGTAFYRQSLNIADGDSVVNGEYIYPEYNGVKLTKIPFVFCNATDLAAEPERPPLLALANASLTIYQGEADYRQSLFMQGQDTLVVKGGVTNGDSVNPNAPVRVGAGARLDLSPEGDAKYIGVNSQGLPEQRKALETDHIDAAARSGQLTRADKASQESGDALRTRVAAKTASLVGIARTGAAALTEILKICAEWVGADPEAVDITPNVDFSKSSMLGQDFVQIMTSKNLGAPISYESIHGWLEDNGMTNMPFESELSVIEKEQEKYKFLQPIAPADQNGLQQGNNQDKKPPAE